MILWEDTVSVSQARFKPTGSALPAAVQTMGTRDLILGTPSCPKLAHPAATHGQAALLHAQQGAISLLLLPRAAEQPGAQLPAHTSCQHRALIPGSPLLSWQEQSESRPAATAPSCSSAQHAAGHGVQSTTGSGREHCSSTRAWHLAVRTGQQANSSGKPRTASWLHSGFACKHRRSTSHWMGAALRSQTSRTGQSRTRSELSLQ